MTAQISRIFFFESQPLMVLGVKALIEQDDHFELCGASGNHETLIDDLKAATPDALLLDLSLYTEESLDFIGRVRAAFPKLGIILLSVHSQPDYVSRARAAGANSYVLKTEEPPVILDAVRATLAGKTYISHRIQQQSDGSLAPPSDSPINLLSKVEFRILQLLGKGRTNRQITEELEISTETLESEMSAIQQKLGLASPVELLQFAFHWVHHEGGFS